MQNNDCHSLAPGKSALVLRQPLAGGPPSETIFGRKGGNSLALFCNFIEWNMFKMFEKGIGTSIGSAKTWSAENRANRIARLTLSNARRPADAVE